MGEAANKPWQRSRGGNAMPWILSNTGRAVGGTLGVTKPTSPPWVKNARYHTG